MEEITSKKAEMAQRISRFLQLHWRRSATGFLLGAVLGFAASTTKHLASQGLKIALKFIHSYLWDVPIWPTHGKVTLLFIVAIAAVVYTVRSVQFLLRFWRSWWSGLVSGVEVVWFLSAGGAFTCLSLTGRYRSLLVLGVGLLGSVLLWYRDVYNSKTQGATAEADPDKPIEGAEEDILNRGAVVASIVRAIVSDFVPVLAVTGESCRRTRPNPALDTGSNFH